MRPPVYTVPVTGPSLIRAIALRYRDAGIRSQSIFHDSGGHIDNEEMARFVRAGDGDCNTAIEQQEIWHWVLLHVILTYQ